MKCDCNTITFVKIIIMGLRRRDKAMPEEDCLFFNSFARCILFPFETPPPLPLVSTWSSSTSSSFCSIENGYKLIIHWHVVGYVIRITQLFTGNSIPCVLFAVCCVWCAGWALALVPLVGYTATGTPWSLKKKTICTPIKCHIYLCINKKKTGEICLNRLQWNASSIVCMRARAPGIANSKMAIGLWYRISRHLNAMV